MASAETETLVAAGTEVERFQVVLANLTMLAAQGRLKHCKVCGGKSEINGSDCPHCSGSGVTYVNDHPLTETDIQRLVL